MVVRLVIARKNRHNRHDVRLLSRVPQQYEQRLHSYLAKPPAAATAT